MSIVDITADPDADDRASEGLIQTTPEDDWDVSELAGSRAPEPGPHDTDGAADASTGASEEVSPRRDESPDVRTRPTFTITEASTACAVSRKTITRKLTDLAEYGAAKDEDGVWRIPVEALLAVGLHPGRSVPATPRPAAGRPAASAAPRPTGPVLSPAGVAITHSPVDLDVVTIPRDRWDDLRLRLARAEAEAAERALALADARLALRALTAGPHLSPTRPDNLFSGTARPGVGTGVPTVPTPLGWVMGTAPSEPTPAALGDGAPDPGAAPSVAVALELPRRRRWWQSATR